MKTEFFSKLYITDLNTTDKSALDSLVICGTQNWDFYFSKKPKNCKCEVLENISLVEFDSLDEFKFYKKYNIFLDFSLEHKRPMALIDG